MMSFRRKIAIYILSALAILALSAGLVFAAGCSSANGVSKGKDGGDIATTSVETHSDYTGFSGSKTFTNGSGYWYLESDFSGTITIESGMPEICLHGHKLTGNIVVKDGAGLLLVDCSSDHSGTVTGGTGYTIGSQTYGGGIYVGDGCCFYMQTGNVCNCSANVGGAIYVGKNSEFWIGDDVYIYGNTSTCKSSSYSCVGAVVCSGCSSVEMFDMSVYDNEGTCNSSSTAYGGAGVTFVDCDDVYLHDGVSIYGNASGGFYGGAGLYFNDSSGTVEDAKIYDNSAAAGFGAGVMMLGGSVSFSNCEIYSNNAYYGGGGAYVGGGSLSTTFTDCNIHDNTVSSSGGSGGGLAIDSKCNVELKGSTAVKGNTAPMGGGVYIYAGTLKMAASASSITGNTATAEGGGIYMYGGSSSDATFTMSAGTISDNHVADGGNGGGISAATKSSVTISGGSVSGNVLDGAGYGAGIYLSKDAAAKLSGGSVSSNEAAARETFGGGVAIVDSAALTISGCSINDNYCYWNGGGLYITDNGTVTMSSGSISGNYVAISSARGGGIDMDGNAVFDMSGGSITKNDNPNGYGGAICMTDSTKCTFNMSGGSITGNTAMYWGGVYSKGTINLSGKIIISDNYDKWSYGVMYTNRNCDTPADLLVYSSVTINLVGEIKSGSSIGVVFSRSGPDATQITSSESKTTYYQSAASYFFLDMDDLRAEGYAIFADSANSCVSLKEPDLNAEAYIDSSGTRTFYDTLAEALTAAEGTSVSNAGTVYLNNDVTLTSTYSVNGYVTLDLNGFSLTCSASRAFYVYGNFTLKDSTGEYADLSSSSATEGAKKNTSTDSDGRVHITYTVTYSTDGSTGEKEGAKSYHTYTAGAIYGISGGSSTNYGSAVFVSPGGIFEMYGGIIADNDMYCGVVGTGGNSSNSSTAYFNMYGGCISGNRAVSGSNGAVYLGTYSVAHIYAGVISSNTSPSGGGGLSVYMATATLYFGDSHSSAASCGAVISGNSSTSYGGGVYVRRGTMYMRGGEISGNASGDRGGGIYNADEGTLEISGGKIVHNEATSSSYYGGGVYTEGSFSLSGDAVIKWNTRKSSSSATAVNSNLVVASNSYGAYIDGDFTGYIGISGADGGTCQITSKRSGGSSYTLSWLQAHFSSDRTECLGVVDGNYIWQYSSHDFTSSDSLTIVYDEKSGMYVLKSACSHCGEVGDDYVNLNLEIYYTIENGIGYANVETDGGTIISVEISGGFMVKDSGGNMSWYASFSDAQDAARSSGKTIVLLEDITSTYNIIYDMTIDLNGHSAHYFSALANISIEDSSEDKSGYVETIRTGSGCSIVLYGGTYGTNILTTTFDISVATGYTVLVTSDGYKVTQGGETKTDSMTASVTANGVTYYFESFSDAVTYAESLSGDVTVTLLADVSANIEISSTNNITIDLGSHTLSGSVTVADGATLTISENGTEKIAVKGLAAFEFEASSSGIDVTLNSGSSVSGLEVASGSVSVDLCGGTINSLEISSTGASVTVSDSSTDNSGTISNIKAENVSSSTLTIEGGTYVESQVEQIYGCLENGYVIYFDGTGYQVIEEDALSAAAVSVTYTSGGQDITIYFDFIEDAVKYAETLTDVEEVTIKLLEDIDSCDIDISSSNITIDLNNHTLGGDIDVGKEASVTFVGSGEIDLGSGSSVEGEIEIASGNVMLDLGGNNVGTLTVGDGDSSNSANVTVKDSSAANNGTIETIVVSSSDGDTVAFEGGKYTKDQVEKEVYVNLASGSAIYCDGSDFYVEDESAAKSSAKVSLTYTTSDGKKIEIYFGNIESAINYANSFESDEKATITLLEDIENCSIDISSSNITIDLNNHTLGGDIDVEETSSVTIVGDGEINLESGSSVEGKIEIASGNVTVDLGGCEIGSLVVGDDDPDMDAASVTIVDSSNGNCGTIGEIEIKNTQSDTLAIEGGSYKEDQIEQVYGYLDEDEYAIKYDPYGGSDGDGAYTVVTKDEVEGAAATVTVTDTDGNTSTVYFDDIKDAVEYAERNSDGYNTVTITLEDDVTDGMTITDGEIELDLNGYTVESLTIGDTGDGSESTIAKVTITDSSEDGSGSVESLDTTNMGEEESLEISGGTFSSNIYEYVNDETYEIIYGTDEAGEFDSWRVVEKSEIENEAAAAVTIGEAPEEVTYYFETFEDAFAYATNVLSDRENEVSSVAITLYDDVSYEEDNSFEISTGSVTIDLNGHALNAYISIEADAVYDNPSSTEPGAGGSLYVKDSSSGKSGSIEGTIKVTGTSSSDDENSDETGGSEGTYANTLIFEDVTPNQNLKLDFTDLKSSASTTLKYAFGSIEKDGEGDAYYGIIFNHEHVFDIEVWERTGDGSYTLRFMCSCGTFEYKCTGNGSCGCEYCDDGGDDCTCDESCECAEYVVYGSEDVTVTYTYDSESGEVTITMTVTFGADDSHYDAYSESSYTASNTITMIPAVSVTVEEGDEIFFDDLEEALAYAESAASGSKSVTVTLYDDIETLEIDDGTIEIDLNGNSIGTLTVGDDESVENTVAKVTVTDSSAENSGSIESIEVKGNGTGNKNALEILGGSYSYENINDVAANIVEDFALLYDPDSDSYKVVEKNSESVSGAEVSLTYKNENDVEVEIYFDSIEDAISYAESLSGDSIEVTITLESDIASCDIEITSDNITIDLNGNTLEGNIVIDDGATLSIEGSGEIEATIDIAEGGNLTIAADESGIDITLEEGSSMNGTTEVESGNVTLDLGGNTLKGEVDVESGATLTITGSGEIDATVIVEGEDDGNAGTLIIEADSKDDVNSGDGITVKFGEDSDMSGDMQISSGDVTVDLAGCEISSLVIGDENPSTSANVTITDSKDSSGNSGTIDSIEVKDDTNDKLAIEGGSYDESQIEQIYENLDDDEYAIKYDPDGGSDNTGAYEVVTKEEAEDGAAASVTVTDTDGNTSTVYFDDISEAVDYAASNSDNGNTVTITLEDDVVDGMAITDGTVEVDLNGHSIDELTIGDESNTDTTANVTITDSSDDNSGTVEDINFADETSNDSLTIEGGTYAESQIDEISEYLSGEDFAIMYDPEGGANGEGAYTVVEKDTAKDKAEVSLAYTNEEGQDVEIYFESIEDAIDYASGLVDESSGEGPDVTITLLYDVEDCEIEITTDNITIDLGGNTLSGDISIANDAYLTIEGSGEIGAVFDVAGETEEGAGDAGKLIIEADSKSGYEGGIEITLEDGSSFEGEMDVTYGDVTVDLAGCEIDTLVVGDGNDTNGSASVTIKDTSDEGCGFVGSFSVAEDGSDNVTIVGGNFSDDISIYIGEDSEIVRGTDENGDETYHAVSKEDVEKIAAASVTTDEGTYYFETFEDALAFANSEGGTIKLFEDVEYGDAPIEISEDVTLDLNGHAVIADITVEDGASLVITDTSVDGTEGDVSDCTGSVVGTISGSDVTVEAGQYTDDVSEYLGGEGLYLLIGEDEEGNLTYKVVAEKEIESYAAVKIVDENGNERYYSSASAAFKDASDGDTIVLQADCDKDVTLSANGNVTLDLNGHTLDGNITVGEGSQSVILTIADSSFSASGTDAKLGTGAVTGEISSNNYSSVVATGGTYSFDLRDEGYEDIAVADGYTVMVSTDEDETIYIVVEEAYAQYVAVASVIVETEDGESTFYFGSIQEAVKCAEEAAQNATGVTITLLDNATSVEIDSGDITIDLNGHTLATLTVGDDEEQSDGVYAHVTVVDSQNAGTISEIAVKNCDGSENSLSIEGGVYGSVAIESIEEYIEEGFVLVDDGDESYIVASLDDIESVAAASVSTDEGTLYFEYFGDALSYVCIYGGKLTLYTDVDNGSNTIEISKNIEIDLNGHTLNATIEVDASSGSLAVTDSADGGEILGKISVKDSDSESTEEKEYSSALVFEGGVTPSENLEIDLKDLGTDGSEEAIYVFSETGSGGGGETTYGIVKAADHTHAFNIAVWERDGEKIILKVMCACGSYYEETIIDETTGNEFSTNSFAADAADVKYTENEDGTVTVSTVVTVIIDGETSTFEYTETFAPIASVTATVDGKRTTVYFDDLEKAIDYAAANGGSMTLLADIEGGITVSDGVMNLDLNGHTVTGGITVSDGASLTVTDSGDSGYVKGNVQVTDGGSLTLMGGTYGVDVSDYVASGYVAVIKADGTYFVTNSSNAEPLSEAAVTTDDGTLYFESFDDALEYAKTLAEEGEVTIILFKDIEEDIEFSSGSYTLDLNGNKISGDIVVGDESGGTSATLTITDGAEKKSGNVAGSLSVATSDSAIILDGGTYSENILETEGVEIGEGLFVLVESEEDKNGNKTYTYTVTDSDTAEDMAAASVTFTDEIGGNTVYFEDIADAIEYAEGAASDEAESVTVVLWDDVDEIEFASGSYELDLNGCSVDSLTVGDENKDTAAHVTITDSSDGDGYVGTLVVNQADEQAEKENSVTIESGAFGSDVLEDGIEIEEGAFVLVGDGDEDGNRTYIVTDSDTAENTAAASVTYTDESGEKTVYFENIDDAISYAEQMAGEDGMGVEVTLYDDVDEITFASGDYTLDLNGHSVDSLTVGDEDKDTAAHVTITDSSEYASGYVEDITVNQAAEQSEENGLSIEGGTYSQNVEDYLDEDHAMIFGTDEDGAPTFTVESTEEIEDMAAAKVVTEEGEKIYFASIEDAVEYAATSGGTVTLLDDGELSIRISDELSSSKDFVEIEIDLNGYTLCADITLDAATGSLVISDSSDNGSGNGTGKVEGTILVITTGSLDGDYSDTLVFDGTSPNADLDIDLSGLGRTQAADESGEYENTYVFEKKSDGTYSIADAASHNHSYTIEVWTRDGEKVTLRLMCACGDYFEEEGSSSFEAVVSYDVSDFKKSGTVEILAEVVVNGKEYTYTETIEAVASVEASDGSTIYFDDLQDAIEYAQSCDAAVKLLADIDADIVTTKDVTIDLNGHTLAGSLDVESGTTAIVDNSTDGKIKMDCDVTVESGATLIIGKEDEDAKFDVSGSVTIEDGGKVTIIGSGEISAELEIEGTIKIDAAEEGVVISGNVILSGGEIDAEGKLSIIEEITAIEGTENKIGGENASLEILGIITVEEGATLEIEGTGEIRSELSVEDGGTLKISGSEQDGITLDVEEDTILRGTLDLEGDVTVALNGNDLDADLEIEDGSEITLDGQGGTIKLEDNLETSGSAITIASDTAINLNGHKMSLETEEGEYGITVEEGTLSVSDSARGGKLETDILVDSGAEIELRDDVIDGYYSGHGDGDDYTVTFGDGDNLLSSAQDSFGNIYYETVTGDEHSAAGCNHDFVEVESFDAATCILTLRFYCLCGETWTETDYVEESEYSAYAASSADGEYVEVDIEKTVTVSNPISGVAYTYKIEYETTLEMYTEGQKDDKNYEDENYAYSYKPASCTATGSHTYTYKGTGVKVVVEIPKTHTAEACEYSYTISGVTYTVTYYICTVCRAILFTLDGGYTGDEDGLFETDDILNYGSEEDLKEDLENYAQYEETKNNILESIEESVTGHMGKMGSVSQAYDKILDNLDDSTYEWQTGSSEERSEYMEQMMAELEELQTEAEFQMNVAVAQGLLTEDLQSLYEELLASGNYEEGSEAREQLDELIAEAKDGVGDLNISSGATPEEIDEITRQYYAKIIELIYKIRLYSLSSGEGYVRGEVSNDLGFDGDSTLAINETTAFDLNDLLGRDGFTYISMTTGETLTDEDLEALFDGMSVLAGYSVSLMGAGDVEITSYNGVYKIKIALPDDLADREDGLTIVYIGNDGTVEVYAATIEGGYIVFETTHFSNYYIVGEKTSDYSSAITFLGIVLIVELILAAILLGVYFAKKFETTRAKVLWTLLYALVAAAGVAIAISVMVLAVSLAAVVAFAILCAAMLVADVALLYLALSASSETEEQAEAAKA